MVAKSIAAFHSGSKNRMFGALCPGIRMVIVSVLPSADISTEGHMKGTLAEY